RPHQIMMQCPAATDEKFPFWTNMHATIMHRGSVSRNQWIGKRRSFRHPILKSPLFKIKVKLPVSRFWSFPCFFHFFSDGSLNHFKLSHHSCSPVPGDGAKVGVIGYCSKFYKSRGPFF